LVLVPVGAASPGDVGFLEHAVSDYYFTARWVDAADIDGDGSLDVVSVSQQWDRVSWWKDLGNDVWEEHVVKTGFVDATCVHAVDLNGDDHVDIVATAFTPGDILWFENDGNGSFTEHTVDASFSGVQQVTAADIDGDGDNDLAAGALWADQIAWWENDGLGGFSKHLIQGGYAGASYVDTADFDKDGHVDVVGCDGDRHLVTWWRNVNGDGGSWQEATVASGFSMAKSAYASDMNNDGWMDIVAASYSAGTVVWWENDHSPLDGGWIEHPIATGFPGTLQLVAADVDGTGYDDVVAASNTAGNITLWRNQGGSGFEEQVIADDLVRSNSVFVVDLDSDGDNDILGAGLGSHTIKWWENLSPGAEFAADPLWGMAPLEVQFTDQSSGDVTSWSWDLAMARP
jgi:hypothetical protein